MSDLVLIPYTDIEAFADAATTIVPDGMLPIEIRIADFEHKVQAGGGFRRTPYVIAQARQGDEIHILRLVGETYEYWGDSFPEHVQAYRKALQWIADITNYLKAYVENLKLRAAPSSYYYHPHIGKVAGIYYGAETPILKSDAE